MGGALLRSGKSSSLKALGKTGQPVYRAAHQIRSALQRKDPLAAEKLAIPQSDQQGDNIDWYSPVEGDVIPWSAATEEERHIARHGLHSLEHRLTNMRESILAPVTNSPQTNADKLAFAELLEHVIRFPSEDYVYIVRTRKKYIHTTAGREVRRTNSVAVLTFWGFVHSDDDLSNEPLYCLNPSPKSVAPAVEPGVTPPAVGPTGASVLLPQRTGFDDVVPPSSVVTPEPRRSWWRRWWWLLLPLLLLLLLPFLLRGCVPGASFPDLLGGGGTGFEPPRLPSLPSIGLPQVNIPGGSVGVSETLLPADGNSGLTGPGNGSSAATSSGAVDQSPLAPANADNAQIPPPGTEEKSGVDAQIPPELRDTAGSAAEPSAIPGESPSTVKPPAIPDEAPASPPANGKGLQIPDNVAANGPADFLNGNWQAGAGIQDKKTGKPLRLQYQFKNGQGEVTVQRPDGVRCSGPVAAAMKDGNLSIDSQGQVSCEDGGSYEMPAVSCRHGSGAVADCNGSYSNDHFPMTMRNAEK